MLSAYRDAQIPTNYKEKKTKEAFSFLRFSAARDAELMLLSAADNFKVIWLLILVGCIFMVNVDFWNRLFTDRRNRANIGA